MAVVVVCSNYVLFVCRGVHAIVSRTVSFKQLNVSGAKNQWHIRHTNNLCMKKGKKEKIHFDSQQRLGRRHRRFSGFVLVRRVFGICTLESTLNKVHRLYETYAVRLRERVCCCCLYFVFILMCRCIRLHLIWFGWIGKSVYDKLWFCDHFMFNRFAQSIVQREISSIFFFFCFVVSLILIFCFCSRKKFKLKKSWLVR